MNESELKAQFASFLLLKPEWPLDAALKLYPADKDRGIALRIAFAWPTDPEVIIEMERLKSETVSEAIPTKEKVIAEMWGLAQSEKVAPKDRVAMSRLIAEMLGYIAKPVDTDELPKRMPSAPVYKIVDR